MAEQVDALVKALAERLQGKQDESSNPQDSTALGGAARESILGYRTTAKWIVRAFASVLIAAVGTSPFLVLDEIDSVQEAMWSGWGLAAAVLGSLVAIYVASGLFTPMSVSLGLFLKSDSGELFSMRDEINEELKVLHDAVSTSDDDTGPQDWAKGATAGFGPNVGWRQPKSIDEHLQWVVAIERERWALDEQCAHERLFTSDAATGTETPRLRSLESQLKRAEQHFGEQHAEVDRWLDRVAFQAARGRFDRSRPPLFLAAGLTALGLVIFLAAGQLDRAGDSTPSPALLTIQSIDVRTLVRGIAGADPGGSDCDVDEPISVQLVSGNGSPDSPWIVTSDQASPCGDFEMTLRSNQATIAIRTDPALSSSDRPWEQYLAELSRGEPSLHANLVAWVGLFVTAGLLIASARCVTKGEQSGNCRKWHYGTAVALAATPVAIVALPLFVA